MAQNATVHGVDALVARLGDKVRKAGLQIAIAESLTGGQLSGAIAAGAESETWFRGGIVAYQPSVKYDMLMAPQGPVVTAPTAEAMATAARSLFLADYAAAVTGVGGPGPQEGKPAGTVFIAVAGPAGERIVTEHLFDGDPVEVMNQTIVAALSNLEYLLPS